MRRYLPIAGALMIQGVLVIALILLRWLIISGGEPFSLPAVVEEVVADPRIPEVILRPALSSLSPDAVGGRDLVEGEVVRVPIDGRGWVRGVVTRRAEIVSSWEVVILSLDGTRSIYAPTWFPFREGEMVFGCVDRRGALQHVDRLDGGGDCWNKEWRRIEGKVIVARETTGRRVVVRYGIERFHPPPGEKIPPAGSDVSVQGRVRWGIPVVTGITRSGG